MQMSELFNTNIQSNVFRIKIVDLFHVHVQVASVPERLCWSPRTSWHQTREGAHLLRITITVPEMILKGFFLSKSSFPTAIVDRLLLGEGFVCLAASLQTCLCSKNLGACFVFSKVCLLFLACLQVGLQ